MFLSFCVLDDFFRFSIKLGFWLFLVNATVVSVLLSALVERCFVSRMRDFAPVFHVCGPFSDHVEHVECRVEPQWSVPYTIYCCLLRPLAPHPHSHRCFRGPSRMTRMSLFTPVVSLSDQVGKFAN